MQCIYNRNWRVRFGSEQAAKIRAHRIKQIEVEQAFFRDPILIYEQDGNGEIRYVYYGETEGNRMIAGQRRDYLKRRAQEE